MTEDLLWPQHAAADDLAAIESVPLNALGLPDSTCALLAREATHWPDRMGLVVLPDAARWREPLRTFAELLADVHRVANLLHDLGLRRVLRSP
jgi:fatty-acyl-CoA synthase